MLLIVNSAVEYPDLDFEGNIQTYLILNKNKHSPIILFGIIPNLCKHCVNVLHIIKLDVHFTIDADHSP